MDKNDLFLSYGNPHGKTHIYDKKQPVPDTKDSKRESLCGVSAASIYDRREEMSLTRVNCKKCLKLAEE